MSRFCLFCNQHDSLGVKPGMVECMLNGVQRTWANNDDCVQPFDCPLLNAPHSVGNCKTCFFSDELLNNDTTTAGWMCRVDTVVRPDILTQSNCKLTQLMARPVRPRLQINPLMVVFECQPGFQGFSPNVNKQGKPVQAIISKPFTPADSSQYWTGASGLVKKITSLEDSHLLNIIKLLETKNPEFALWVEVQMENEPSLDSVQDSLTDWEDDSTQVNLDKALKQIRIPPGTMMAFAKYKNALAEAERRGLPV